MIRFDIYQCWHQSSTLFDDIARIGSRAVYTYPIANVLQSADGAKAVTAIWSMVLDEMCSDVVGSKRITFPWVLPASNMSKKPSKTIAWRCRLTECHITIAHPRSCCQSLIGHKSSHFVAIHEIPHDSSPSSISTNDESTSSDFALIVHR